MICKDFENILSNYLEKNLSEEERCEARLHLAACRPCRRLLEDVSWVRTQCEEFPALNPPVHLKRKILESTTFQKQQWKTSEILLIPIAWKKAPFAYALSFVIMIVLIASLLFNAPDLLKGANKQMHQLYSSGVKFYYETEKLREDLAVLKEDLPNRIDSGIARSIDWIKNKIKKEEKKDDDREKAREMQDTYYFIV